MPRIAGQRQVSSSAKSKRIKTRKKILLGYSDQNTACDLPACYRTKHLHMQATEPIRRYLFYLFFILGARAGRVGIHTSNCVCIQCCSVVAITYMTEKNITNTNFSSFFLFCPVTFSVVFWRSLLSI